MKAAIIENNKVINLAKVPDQSFADSQGWVVSDTAKIGDDYNADTGTFSMPPTPIPERKTAMESDADREYQASVERGFTYDGGTFPSTGHKRTRVVELVTQQNAGRGMPGNKTTKRFYDLEGTAHDFTATQIVDLAEAGSNLVEAADDNYEALMVDIQSATTQADLDAIDVTAGWPN